MAVAKSKKSAETADKSSRALKSEGEPLPSPDEAAASFTLALDPSLARPRASLLALRTQPPQLIHLEGGETDQRFALALWWVALLNCETPAADGSPCLGCHSCLRIGAFLFADLICLDGRAASIKIDEVRALRSMLGEPPRFGRKRVLFFAEAQSLGIEAANSLLKVLEDPNPDTCFVFTAPQRERLLPTLVSRGWVVTLPWPLPSRPLTSGLNEWALALAEFAESGTGWFSRSSTKGAVDTVKAQEIVLVAQKALIERLATPAEGHPYSQLARTLEAIPDDLLPALDELLARAQEALQAQVNPALVLDFMASRLHLLTHRQRGF